MLNSYKGHDYSKSESLGCCWNIQSGTQLYGKGTSPDSTLALLIYLYQVLFNFELMQCGGGVHSDKKRSAGDNLTSLPSLKQGEGKGVQDT